MKNIYYHTPSYKVNGIEFGSSVLAIFHPGVKVNEGDSFRDDQFEYVGKMGTDWQKGHLIAKSLGGANEGYNMLPMKQEFNDSEYKSFELRVKGLVDNLSAIQKEVGSSPIYLKYSVEVNPASAKTFKGITIPTQITCMVSIYNDIDGKSVPKMTLACACTKLGLDISVIGKHVFNTD